MRKVTKPAESRSHSVGLTLVESLVVLAILAIVVALLLPGLQAIRQASMRATCCYNLRAIGIAIQQYCDCYGVFPVSTNRNVNVPLEYRLTSYISPHVRLLPYLQRQMLFDDVNFDLSGAHEFDSSNLTAARQSIGDFLCPADAQTTSVNQRHGNSNYCANHGWPRFSTGIAGERSYVSNVNWAKPNGLISVVRSNTELHKGEYGVLVRPSHVVDGLSNTAAFSERLVGVEPEGNDNDERRVQRWSADVEPKSMPEIIANCNAIGRASPNGRFQGSSWMDNWNRVANTYSHLFPPNGRNCAWNGHYDGLQGTTCASQHPGGANVLIADGSVSFVKNSIDIELWWCLGARDDGRYAQWRHE